ncbi:MAG TPA: ABC transporter substrate-binding protein [Ktedonobacteraceae bacterium]|nr:ABC transporter substrate-binding protein [Ktedonobacteraceae bacterium]
MNSWIRRYGLAVGIILAFILSACGSSGTTTTTTSNGTTTTVTHLSIMVGGLSKQIYLPNELTQRLGYFAQQGLDVTLIDEASGQSSEDEVLAGQVQAGSGSYNHTIDLQAAGKNIECVVQLGIAPGEAEIVSAKEANQIHSFADLKGKNLGVTELGSGTQALQIALLHKAGLGPSEAHFIPVGAGDTFIAALQQGRIDAGMTTEPTISRVLSSGVGKVLVDLRTPQSTTAALGGSYPFICLFMKNDYVNSHKDVVQKLVNAYVKTLKWMQTHTAAQIADMMPADYYAGDKTLYVTALQNQMAIFSPDGNMPSDGPASVLSIEQQTNTTVQGKQIDLSTTFTNEFTSKATG